MQSEVAVILMDTLSFAVKSGVVFFTVAAIAVVLVAVSRRGRSTRRRLEIEPLHEQVQELQDSLRESLLAPKEHRRLLKARQKEQKAQEPPKKRIFVVDFRGDLMAHAVESLRHEVTGILGVATADDEVVVRLESPGGVVHGYGLAASQLCRIRERNLRLVVCIDKVAASGGYMMASVAHEILAAPFAVVGSIGVVAQVPNFHRWLNEHHVDYEDMTAGEFKRTISVLGKITPEGRAKFQEQLEETHELFKRFVHENRPSLDLEKVATGEYWHGSQAQALGLVDRLTTSDDYLVSQVAIARLYRVHYRPPRKLGERLSSFAATTADRVLLALWSRGIQAGPQNL